MPPFDGEVYKIDIAFEKERLALELDGPSHFLEPLMLKVRDGGGQKDKMRRDGPTQAKKRMLEGMGWRVSSLSWTNQKKLMEKSEEYRRKFWVKKLGKFGIEPRKR